MRLAVGQRIGPFEVVALLGSGGMGEVYRARDQRLGRDVALKVLSDPLSSHPDRLARFEREARALAVLNHPGIAAIHEVEPSSEGPVLVLELVEGPTLADLLQRGALPLREALDLARQIAEALEAAHEKGILHRDLKPSNIKVTATGRRVKLLDFGLAKALEDEASSADLSQPSPPTAPTQEGLVLGTAPYMSPEQARGEAVDRRTDVWAFGCVAYEMLTGRRAFPGASSLDAIVAVLEREPDWGALPEAMPALARSLLRRCLQKDPGRRLHDIADARIELEEALAQQAAPDRAGAPQRRSPWLAAAIVAAAVIALSALWFQSRPETVSMVSYLVPPDNTTFLGMALSPDGRRIAFMALGPDGKPSLWVRHLDALSAQPLTGTEGKEAVHPLGLRASAPFWSPDGRFLGFFADGKLKKIDASGGAPQTLCDAPTPRGEALGGTWNADGVIVFGRGATGAAPLYRVAASGGVPTPVTELDESRGDLRHMWPAFLPDGRHFLYHVRASNREATGIYAGSLDSKDSMFILRSNGRAVYAPPGYLLFWREGTLLAAPFDHKQLSLTGEPVPLAERVRGYAAPAGGLLAYICRSATPTRLVWLDRSGREADAVPVPGDFVGLDLSNDGRHVAAEVEGPDSNRDIWVYDLTRHVGTRLTFDPGRDWFPVWSPDDDRIAFTSNRKGGFDLYQVSSTAPGTEEPLFEWDVGETATSWSKDGRHLIFNGERGPEQALWSLSLRDKKPTLLFQGPFKVWDGQISPDARWIAYMSDETGHHEIYVQAFPPSGDKTRISTAGGYWPRWRGDGRELFYLDSSNRKLMAVAVSAGRPGGRGATAIEEEGPNSLRAFRKFEARAPEPLFDATTIRDAPQPFDVTEDGQRFLVVKVSPEERAAPIVLVQNWTAALKK